jgi:hypothetical protein
MKKSVPDLSWLPPREEWDFRTVTPAECRVACHWEYSRDIRRIIEPVGQSLEKVLGSRQAVANGARSKSSASYFPRNYRQPASTLFPQAWLSLTKEQRASIVSSFYPVPAVQIRKLGDFFKRMQWTERPHLQAFQPCLEHCYVIQPNFTLCGVEAVLKEFEAWARKEAKNYRPAPRAKAAELPFDALKWLAVSRLEDARRNAAVSFEQVQSTLMDHRRKNPLAARNDSFPIYSSHGAWSKARADAERCRTKLLRQPALFLNGLS